MPRCTGLCRMLDGGVDPLYLARRMTRMAVEDVGLAEPRAWRMALDAWDTYERLGSPEGELGLAQLAIWLAIAPKSNAAYMAYNKARAAIREGGTLEVPMHLRNAPTKLMKGLGYGKGYQYDHDAEGGIALDQQCLPDERWQDEFYEPVERGLELQLREKLLSLRAAREKARARNQCAFDDCCERPCTAFSVALRLHPASTEEGLSMRVLVAGISAAS